MMRGMSIDRRTLMGTPLGLLAVSPLQAALATSPPQPDATYPLWPGEAPGLLDPTLTERVTERSRDSAFRDRSLDRIRAPRIAAFFPKRPTGAAMLVMPGGGYARVVVDKEGYEIGPWLASHGIAAFVLVYRLPGDGWRDRANVALADAQRAMRLIRTNAARWRVDPLRVGAMGFSAGGHVCADLAVRHGRRVYEAVDAADRQDARPTLASPIYPVISMDPAIAHAGSREQLLGPDTTESFMLEHSPDRQVDAQTPPCFLVHAEDDPTVDVANTLAFRAALKAAKRPVETHLFEKGGHGFGYGRRTQGLPAGAWADLWLAWARNQGFVA